MNQVLDVAFLGKIALGLDTYIGLIALVLFGCKITEITCNYVVETFIGTKYILQYIRDRKGREAAKKKADRVTVSKNYPVVP